MTPLMLQIVEHHETTQVSWKKEEEQKDMLVSNSRGLKDLMGQLKVKQNLNH